MSSSPSPSSRSLSRFVLRGAVFGLFAALLSFNARADNNWSDPAPSRFSGPAHWSPPWAAPAPGLVAWWKMNEGAGHRVSDASGNYNTGILAGAPAPSWVTGNSGPALSFAGNSESFMVVPGGSNLGALSNAVTLTAWVNPAVFDGQVLTKWLGLGAPEGSFILSVSDGHAALQLYLEGSYTPLTGNTVFAGDGKWHHIAATYDGSVMLVYLDGNLDGTRAATGHIDICDADVFIGQEPDGSFSYGGSIDNVRIYNRALPASEIQQLFLNKQ